MFDLDKHSMPKRKMKEEKKKRKKKRKKEKKEGEEGRKKKNFCSKFNDLSEVKVSFASHFA